MVNSYPPKPTAKKHVRPKRKPATVVAEPEIQSLSIQLQQSLLDLFQNTCVQGLASELEPILQEVKGHLYNRDFATAFGEQRYLDAYAARWSPSRALGYAQIFSDISSHISSSVQQDPVCGTLTPTSKTARDRPTPKAFKNVVAQNVGTDSISSTTEQLSIAQQPAVPGDSTSGLDNASDEGIQSGAIGNAPYRIVSIGGGAGAELVGLAGWMKVIRNSDRSNAPDRFEVCALDIAAWDDVVANLNRAIVEPPTLSKYASETARAANKEFLPVKDFAVHFKQQDILETSPSEFGKLLSGIDMVTIMFTLNELYTFSITKTQRFLFNLTSSLRVGALLLVVDSPGSYSSVTINGAEKKYPMQWLLDHTLLQPAEKRGEPQWEKLVSDDSRWFRIPEGLKYPIELENMRYQIHLYRRCGTKDP